GDWKHSAAFLKEGMEARGETNGAGLLVLALARRRLGDGGAARKVYERALDWLKKNELDAGLTPLARQAMVQVAGLSTSRADEMLSRLAEEGRLAVLTKAIGRKPNDPQGYRDRGNWFAGRGQWRKAAADFSQVVRLDRNDHWAGVQLAVLLAQ